MSEVQPIMTIFAGPNGGGKSTLRALLQRQEDLGVEIDADAIAKKKNLTDIQAGRGVIRMVNDCIRSRVSFTLETTLSGKLVLEQMRDARTHGFQIRLLFISLDSPFEHQKRIEQRAARGGHMIPPDDVKRRYYRAHRNLPVAVSLADSVGIYSNTAKCSSMVQIENGIIVERSANPPSWVKNILLEL